jgi:hypothetical protein
MVSAFGWEKTKGTKARKAKSTRTQKTLLFIKRPPYGELGRWGSRKKDDIKRRLRIPPFPQNDL